MERRNFIGGLMAGLAGLLGLRAAKAATQSNTADKLEGVRQEFLKHAKLESCGPEFMSWISVQESPGSREYYIASMDSAAIPGTQSRERLEAKGYKPRHGRQVGWTKSVAFSVRGLKSPEAMTERISAAARKLNQKRFVPAYLFQDNPRHNLTEVIQ